ncbi:hypothetical protein [Mycolicibacterium sp. CBMA 234]|uniref:hypothetical protein n=1 Tax=Mycolicibacterium sp. CBMA 234 TaxID=1918495 RepID=UPI0012DD4208|nr:hypothetical protein [Mycolicibacterium sp. CBMA 234]
MPGRRSAAAETDSGGIRIGGAGGYEAQFNHHMYLPMTPGTDQPAPPDPSAPVDGSGL